MSRTLASATSAPLLLLVAALPSCASDGASDVIALAVAPQQPDGYPGNPSTLLMPLRQDLTELELVRDAGQGYTLRLGSDEGAVRVPALDLRPWIPAVPRLARDDETLTRVALMQREFNRNETRFDGVDGVHTLKLANNCLKQGLWEISLERQLDDGRKGQVFHGWFTFPEREYARVFGATNALEWKRHAADLAQYPAFGGFELPLTRLRSVESSQPCSVALDLDGPRKFLPEQQRKAGLLLDREIHELGDFYAEQHQPIRTAKFNEPGFYDLSDPMSFDLRWLGQPVQSHWRRVRGVADASARLDEIEVVFANGHRLIVADGALATLAARDGEPRTEADVLRVTFGISTPDIYASLAERQAEFEHPRDNYLFLLDAQGRHLDNHTTGLDRVFLWRAAGDPDRLHLWLIGYERIAIVGDLSLPWPTS